MEARSDITPHLFMYYTISRQDVENYLMIVRQNPLRNFSLNDYLSEILNAHVIAECHDATLRGLDLSDGDFSEVNFRRANLMGCQLTRTRWHRAHLECTQIGRQINGGLLDGKIKLDGAVFNKVYADGSVWRNVNFIGADFSQARMRGTYLKSCISSAQQLDANWALVQLENTVPAENYAELEKKLKEQNDEINILKTDLKQLKKEADTVKEKAAAEEKKEVKRKSDEDMAITASREALLCVSPIARQCISSWYDHEHFNKDRDDLKDNSIALLSTLTEQNEKYAERKRNEQIHQIITMGILRGYLDKTLKLNVAQRQMHRQKTTMTLLKDVNEAKKLADRINGDLNNPKAKKENELHQWHLINFLSVELSRIAFVRSASTFGWGMNGAQNACASVAGFFSSKSQDQRRYYYSAKVPVIELDEQAKENATITISESVVSHINSASY